MSAPKWEAPSELYFYDEWLQQNAKGRMLCGNNRYVRADLCTPTDERVKALVKALQNVIAEYDEFRKDEYMRGLASLDDEIYDARAALRDMGADT